MACRVGMSTNPEQRFKFWKWKEGHTHSELLSRKIKYEKAIERVKQEAEKHGCVTRPGGAYKEGRVWTVYRVWGGKNG